jgi:hypothetical protein
MLCCNVMVSCDECMISDFFLSKIGVRGASSWPKNFLEPKFQVAIKGKAEEGVTQILSHNGNVLTTKIHIT